MESDAITGLNTRLAELKAIDKLNKENALLAKLNEITHGHKFDPRTQCCLLCNMSEVEYRITPYIDRKVCPEIALLVHAVKAAKRDDGITSEEKLCLNYLADAWNAFIKLDHKQPQDNPEFCTAIHAAMNLIALRVARRIDKDVWTQPEENR